MTVRDLLDRIDSRELSEWIAFFRIEPLPSEKADWRHGHLSQTIVNALVGGKNRRVKIADFIPEWGKKIEKGKSPEHMKAIMKAFTVSHNGSKKVK